MSVKEIAKRAGTSTATVSRVLTDPEYRCRSFELQQRIWEIAQEINYIPNEAARALKKGESSSEVKEYYVNILITRSGDSETDPFFEEVLRLLTSELLRKSCIIANIWRMPNLTNDSIASASEINENVKKVLAQSKNKNDGLIFLGKSKDKVYKVLSDNFKAIVGIQRNRPGYLIDEVLGNGTRIGKKAVEYLYSLGHRKIAYVGDIKTVLCFKGYMEAIRELGLDYNVNYVIEANRKAEEGQGILRRIMSLNDGPTAIYCPCDFVAISVLNSLKRYSKRSYTPSIISSDGIEDDKYCKPMLTSIEHPKDIMVKYATYLLLDRLNGGHKTITHMEVESQLVIRDSCTTLAEGTMFDYCI
jgi:DNA-binding LacI/PurR family transcriptional regulator